MPRLVYFVSEDWFFLSHFVDRAVAAQQAGFDVHVVTRVASHGEAIRRTGLSLHPLDLDRSGIDLRHDLRSLAALTRLYRRLRPDIVHHFALKPILYGTLAARAARVPHVVNAPVGMGFVFTSSSAKARLLRPWVALALRLLLSPRGGHVVVENEDDLRALVAARMARPDAASLIRGAGVSLTEFSPSPEPAGPPVVSLVARMLRDKGVVEFVEAARRLRAEGVPASFRLVGAPDPYNPASIERATLEGWMREGVIEWLGHRTDIADLLRATHVACLPSYREGLPKALLEAAASGRPIVTTDVPGCREVVRDGVDGLLVPPREIAPLADALRRLLLDPGLRAAMGAAARARAVEAFSVERVNAETLALYRRMLGC